MGNLVAAKWILPVSAVLWNGSLAWAQNAANAPAATAIPAISASPLKGRVVSIQNERAVVQSPVTAKPQPLPLGNRAQLVTLSRQGTAIYFVTPPGKPAQTEEGEFPPARGYFSVPPYNTAQGLPAALQNLVVYSANWNATGDMLVLSTATATYGFKPGTGQVLPLRDGVAALGTRAILAEDGNSILLTLPGGKKQTVFDARLPQGLFAALRAARQPQNLKELSEAIDPQLWREGRNWSLSNPAVAPDGSRVYFAANGGTGMGAAGNTIFALFSYDVKTGKLAVLSKPGSFFGRIPLQFELSPDGKRLLMVVSVHSSAVENTCFARVVDLETQATREILMNLPEARNKANFVDTFVWSPDSRFIALTANFYDVAQLLRSGELNRPAKVIWTTRVIEAATGKVAAKLPGGNSLSWCR